MPVDFRWNDDRTALYFTCTGAWNWGEVHRTLKRATLWLDTHDRPVTAILDLRAGERLPAGIVGHVRSLPNSFAHPRASRRMILLGVPDEAQRILQAQDGRITAGDFTIAFAADETAIDALLGQP